MSEPVEQSAIHSEDMFDVDEQRPVPTKIKDKKAMSDDRRAQLLENLKKGRETSKANRAKKALAKKITKRNAMQDVESIIKQDVIKQSNTCTVDNKAVAFYESSIEKLKKEVEQLKLLKPHTPPQREPVQQNVHVQKPKTTHKEPPKFSSVDQSLVTRKDTETECDFSTFNSTLWG